MSWTSSPSISGISMSSVPSMMFGECCPLLRLWPEAPWGPERGGLAHRSLPWAMRRLAYSGLFLMPSMALMALEMFVKLTNAQFLQPISARER